MKLFLLTQLQDTPQGFNQYSILPNKEQGERVLLAQRITLAFYVINVLVMFVLYMYFTGNDVQPRLRGNIMLINSLGLILSSSVLTVLFFIWIYRAYSNLHTAGIKQVRHAKVWAVLAWFIPFMNFIRPYIILKEIWYWGQSKFREKEIVPEPHTWLRYWWISIFIPVPVAMVMAMLFDPNDHPLRILYAMQFMSGIFQCLTLYCFYRFMLRITAVEDDFVIRFAEHQKNELAKIASEYRGTLQSTISEYHHEFQLPQQKPITHSDYSSTSEQSKPLVISLYILVACFTLIVFADSLPSALNSTIYCLALLTVLAAIAFFIGWLKSSYRNLQQLRIDKLSVSENLAATWWVIPVANIYLPYLMLRDLRLHLQTWPNSESTESDPQPLLDWSWMSFMISIVFVCIASALGPDEHLNQSDQLLVLILHFGSLFAIIFALTGAILCIRKILVWENGFLEKVRNNFKERNDSNAGQVTSSGTEQA